MRVKQTDALPWYLAPIPSSIEAFALRHAWSIVGVNLIGAAYGFWYYVPQFRIEPIVAWPVIPDSPVVALFVALSLTLCELGRQNEYLNALAFVGCIKFGLWTPYVLTAFSDAFLTTLRPPPPLGAVLDPALAVSLTYGFLFGSHVGMVAQAFLVSKYGDFSLLPVFTAAMWYGLNDLMDYFTPVVGSPHHTFTRVEPIVDGTVQHISPAHEIAAIGAIAFSILAITQAVLISLEKNRERSLGKVRETL